MPEDPFDSSHVHDDRPVERLAFLHGDDHSWADADFLIQLGMGERELYGFLDKELAGKWGEEREGEKEGGEKTEGREKGEGK